VSKIAAVILAVDPGNQKCGLAVVTERREVLDKSVVNTNAVVDATRKLLEKYSFSLIVIGDRTKSKTVRKSLAVFGLPVEVIDENYSSLEGRRRYLEDHSEGWKRFWPIGLRTPDQPYDDYVAVILAERFFKKRCSLPVENGYNNK